MNTHNYSYLRVHMTVRPVLNANLRKIGDF